MDYTQYLEDNKKNLRITYIKTRFVEPNEKFQVVGEPIKIPRDKTGAVWKVKVLKNDKKIYYWGMSGVVFKQIFEFLQKEQINYFYISSKEKIVDEGSNRWNLSISKTPGVTQEEIIIEDTPEVVQATEVTPEPVEEEPEVTPTHFNREQMIERIKKVCADLPLDKPKVEPTITHKEFEMSKALTNWELLCKTKENCTSINDAKIKFFIKNHLDDSSMPGFGNFKKLHKELKEYALAMVCNAPKRQEFIQRLISYLEREYSIVEEMKEVALVESKTTPIEVNEIEGLDLENITDEELGLV